MNGTHHWKVRLVVCSIMLLMAFLGIFLTDMESSGGWDYWKWTVPIYAVLALGLSWYDRRTKEALTPITIGHEFLHWIALFGAVFLVSMFVNIGVLSRSLAGLFVLTLLALNVFTLGIYMDPIFMLIGVVLGILAAIIALTVQYMYAFSIPLLFIGAAAIGYMIWHSHQKR